MKKGLLQRASKEVLVFTPPEVKKENIVSSSSNIVTSQTNRSIITPTRTTEVKSMIAIRKDYSYKKTLPVKPSVSSTTQEILRNNNEEPDKNAKVASNWSSAQSENNKQPPIKIKRSFMRELKSPGISILERFQYNKDELPVPKVIKIDEISSAQKLVIVTPKEKNVTSPTVSNSNKNELLVPQYNYKLNLNSDQGRLDKSLKKLEKKNSPKITNIKREPPDILPASRRSTEPKDSQNINKINNKINIIFKLNNDKHLRKNIILHHRTPKKMVQKKIITIKEANNNNNNGALPPERITHSVKTQTEHKKNCNELSVNNLLVPEEAVEHVFFERAIILICLQESTISFFEFDRLGCLLKKGRNDFKLIDRIGRRIHDTQVDAGNKFQRICYNEPNPLPIYVEMRAKQKILESPEMSPFTFLYCNVYYIDSEQRKAKFSSVHLDTVKGIVSEITFTAVPNSSYFIMAWVELSLENKSFTSGIVKYKLTPNLDLAKLASIRQFPKLNYRIRQMNCSQGPQLITNGDSQISIFNYESGDLLLSLDLVKNYGSNLTTFGYKENFLFMVQLADGDDDFTKRVNIICVNKCDGNTFKVIQSTTVRIGKSDRIVSRSITSTNHLLVTFCSGKVLMQNLSNFRDIHCESSENSSIFAAGDHLLVANHLNLGLFSFPEYFINVL